MCNNEPQITDKYLENIVFESELMESNRLGLFGETAVWLD